MDTDIITPKLCGVRGLHFRNFRPPGDFREIHRIFSESAAEDCTEYTDTVDEIANYYRNLANCDPDRDVLFVEAGGRAVGYSRVWFVERTDVPGYNYQFFAALIPEWRGKGIREAMLEWCESRIAGLAAEHRRDAEKNVYVWPMDTERDWLGILEKSGYRRVRYGFLMLRPNLDSIPDCPLPQGLEVRPVKPEHYRKIWDADIEASQDGWMKLKAEEQWFENMLASRLFQPHLWQVAWDGDRVAGAVQNYIDPEENLKFGRKRGWTENIHVGREWRGRRLAQALIARSFMVLKEQGMKEAALAVDAENPTGALHLYRKMGFREYKTSYTYTKKISEIVTLGR